jgi:hypothetical protein
VDPEDDWQIFGIAGGIDVEHLTLVRRTGVRNVAFDVLSLGLRQKHNDGKEINEELHGPDPLMKGFC